MIGRDTKAVNHHEQMRQWLLASTIRHRRRLGLSDDGTRPEIEAAAGPELLGNILPEIVERLRGQAVGGRR